MEQMGKLHVLCLCDCSLTVTRCAAFVSINRFLTVLANNRRLDGTPSPIIKFFNSLAPIRIPIYDFSSTSMPCLNLMIRITCFGIFLIVKVGGGNFCV